MPHHLGRLRSERGIALPLTLGVMFVLTISVLGLVQYTAANSRTANLSFTGQSSKGIAEGGVNHVASALARRLETEPSFTGNLSGTATIQGQSVPWTLTYLGPEGEPDVWRASATASLANPTGPATRNVSRTVTAKFKKGMVPDFEAWKGVYAANQGSDCFMQNAVVVKTPVYIRQTSDTTATCIKNTGTRYLGNYLAIRGQFVSQDTGATVGQPASASQPGDPGYPGEYRVPDIHFSGGCGGSSAPYTQCTETHRVYRCTTGAPCYDHVVPDIPKPPVDFPGWKANAKPGPGTVGTGTGKWANGCSTWSGSPPSFTTTSEINIMGAAYNCEVWQDGELKGKIQWTPGTFSSSNTNGTAGTLTIHGTVYFNAKLLFPAVYGKVSGTGTIYVEQSIMMDATPGGLCGKLDTTAGRPLCNFSEGSDGWDPGNTTDLLYFVTGYKDGTGGVSMDIKNQFEFQGGAYTVGKFILQNQAMFKGPLLTEKLELKNDSVIQGWTPLNFLPPGAPGTKPGLELVTGSWRG